MNARLWSFVLAAALVFAAASRAAAQFDTPNRSFHNATAFRLEGQHLTVPCEDCHLNGQYQGTPTTCYECHWVRRKDDRYETRLGTRCEECHRPISWTAVTWDHGGQAGVPLGPVHRTLQCEACHTSTIFTAPVACVSCHQRDYAATTMPSHAAAGFPVTCDSCHRPADTTWRTMGGGGFEHNAIFALVGVHATVACQSCHVNNVYLGTPRECIGCHQADYNRTTSPNHAAAGFPTTCDSCHRATDPQWQSNAGGGFDHNAIFPLVGTHSTLSCQSCHVNNVYLGTPRECVGCHLADYNRTTSPNHATAGFPTTCETCHRPTDPQWQSASFDHSSVYQLVGVHATLACTTCHVNNVYAGTPTSCVGCHQSDYNSAKDPNHVAAGFPTACESCHRATDARWQDASFNHNSVYPLVGVHATVSCQTCHVNNVYAGTPTTCVGCHQSDYNNTSNPNHAAVGFATSCQDCHKASDSSWDQAVFSHTAFPLSGPHNVACSSCHTTPNNYAAFSCTVCHSQSETNSHHSEVRGYVYSSAACYSCHPNGRAED